MRTAATLLMWVIVSWFSAAPVAQVPGGPAAKALSFFRALPTRNPDTALRWLRPPPVGADERVRALAVLPERGELQPDRHERVKLATFDDVLAYHERGRIFETKVIDVPQVVVALHQRTVLLISRPALRLLSGAELQALLAHEVGHDYFWPEFERTLARGDRLGRQELELKCDGIAVLTLAALGLDLARLADGLRKQARFNETLGANANAADYPHLDERQQFIRALRGFASSGQD
jgi:Zn-dependent protease with chaperone function